MLSGCDATHRCVVVNILMTTVQDDIYEERAPLVGDLVGGAYIHPARVILLYIVSFGLYWFYWMYRTWKQYRDHTGEFWLEYRDDHHPVWHGLTQLVPVYGWFRFYAHMRQYKALMVEGGVANNLNVGLLITVTVVDAFVGSAAGVFVDLELASDPVVNGVISVCVALVAAIGFVVPVVVLWVVQSNLNRYWASVDSRLVKSCRFGKGEVLCVLLGPIVWLLVVAVVIAS